MSKYQEDLVKNNEAIVNAVQRTIHLDLLKADLQRMLNETAFAAASPGDNAGDKYLKAHAFHNACEQALKYVQEEEDRRKIDNDPVNKYHIEGLKECVTLARKYGPPPIRM